MATTVKIGRFQFQYRTKKEWEDSNLILLKGELAIESDTSMIKIGDGRSYYPDLPYILIGKVGLKDLTQEEIESLRGPQGKGLSVDTYTYDKDGNTLITFSDKSTVTVKKGDPGSIDISTWTEEQKKEFIEKLGIPEPDLSGYVTKEEGKGLSTNDYDNAAKSKVDAIPEDPKYTDTIYDLTPYAKTADVVAKEEGKGLSTNDYDNTAKGKVDAIPEDFVYKDTEYIFGKGLILTEKTVNIDEKYIWETVNLEYIFNKDKDLYIALNAITGLNLTSSIQTLNDLVNSETAMELIANNINGATSLVGSGTAMTAVANSSIASRAIANSSIALSIIGNSRLALTILGENGTAMTAVANSSIASKAIANSKTALSIMANSRLALTILGENDISMKELIDSNLSKKTGTEVTGEKMLLLGAVYDGTTNTYFIKEGSIPSVRSDIDENLQKKIIDSKYGKVTCLLKYVPFTFSKMAPFYSSRGLLIYISL